MNYVSVGDMAQSYMLRKHNVQLKQTMNTLTEEVVSEIRSDIGAAVKGDFTSLSAVQRSIGILTSYNQANTEATVFLGSMQSALDVVQTLSGDVGSALTAAGIGNIKSNVDATTADAAQKFASVVAALNTNVSGRFVFSGNATDTKPLAPADEMLDALETAITGLSAVQDIVDAVDDWFAAPSGGGGFADIGYLGSDDPLSPIRIAEGDAVSVDFTAADPAIRDTLRGFALAALVGEDRVPDDETTRAQLTEIAGTRIMTVEASLTGTRTRLGTAEGLVADAQTRNTAEISALSLTRTSIIGADPYETATALEAVKSQLETLYTLTSRLSSLTLTDYL